MYRIVSFLGILSASMAVIAQEDVLRFRHLVDQDKLSSNSVLSVCQDHQGFMWFGTRDGLNRYDGYEFKTYYSESDDSTSLADNHINVVYEDSRKNLWIGTADGLNRYEREKDRFTRYFHGSDNLSITNPYVWTICEDNTGRIWIGTSSGMNVFDPTSGTFTHYFTIPLVEGSQTLHTDEIFSDSRGTIWIGTRSGLFYFENGMLYPLKLSTLNGQPPVWVRDIIEDQKGNLWIATELDGIFQVDQTGNLRLNLTSQSGSGSIISNRVRAIHEAQDGKIWIGTREGLSIYDPLNGSINSHVRDKYDPSSLSQNSIRDITSDQWGGIWLTTYAGGINYYHPNQNIFHLVRENLISDNTLIYNRITYLLKDSEGLLWIGTEGRGLAMLDETKGIFRHFPNEDARGERQIVTNNIKSITEGRNGDLWIGTNGGLVRFNKEKARFTNFHHDPDDSTSLSYDQVHSTILDRHGNLWVGTNGGGLDQYIPGQGFIHHAHRKDVPGLIHNSINVLLQDEAGMIWIGTQAGLDCFDPNTGQFQASMQNPEVQTSLPEGRIISLYEDSRGRFWIGSDGQGLMLLNRQTYSLNSITKSDGLPNNVVNAIIEDDLGNLWISTNRGITRISINENLGDGEREISLRNLNVSDGLQGLQFYPRSAMKDDSGRIYFGGFEGYNFFDPERISDETYTPKVMFTDFRIRNDIPAPGEKDSPLSRNITSSEQITLNYRQREFSLTFAGLHFLNPGNLHYSYAVEGLDGQWNELGNQRTITFAYLKPGDYKIMVRASDDPNNWGEQYSTLSVTVLPPPWRTWWAFLLYIVLLTATLFSIWLYARRWYRLRNKLMVELLHRENEEEINQMRTRFFTDISHELRTPLTLILSPLEKLVNGLESNFRLKNQLVMIQRNGKKMLGLINQLLDLRKFDTGHMDLQAAHGNVARFIRETTLSFRELAKTKGILFEFSSTSEEIEAWYDRSKLEIVLYNLLSNAFKATKSGDFIMVEVSEVSRSLGAFREGPATRVLPAALDEFVKISIKDCGKGIPSEQLDQLFDRFYKIDDPDMTVTTGTGIGLELTKRMVELHHGSIEVESEVAREGKPGMTVFTILLPKGKDHLDPKEIIDDFRNSEDPSLYRKELLTTEILIDQQKDTETALDDLLEKGREKPEMVVVEDNTEVCAFIRDLFRDKFRVHTAYDGEQGWERILAVIPDIVISDVMMPRIDGIELCRLLKSDKRTSHIPVILLTARTAVTFKYEGLETGADDYIQKPFSAEYLNLRINNLIRQRRLIRDHFIQNGRVKPEELPILSMDEKILQKAILYIEEHLSDPELSVESLSREIGLSRVHFYRKLKHLTQLSPVEFIRSVRLKKAAQLLEQGKLTISEIRYMIGIQDADYFRKSFKKQFGMNPKDYAGQIPGE